MNGDGAVLPGRTWWNLAPTAQASGQWGVVTAGRSPGWAWVSVLIQGQASKSEAQPRLPPCLSLHPSTALPPGVQVPGSSHKRPKEKRALSTPSSHLSDLAGPLPPSTCMPDLLWSHACNSAVVAILTGAPGGTGGSVQASGRGPPSCTASASWVCALGCLEDRVG